MSGHVCTDTWKSIIKRYEKFIGRLYWDTDNNRSCTFFGIVYAEDDYYYGMVDSENKLTLVSCVGDLKSIGFRLLSIED